MSATKHARKLVLSARIEGLRGERHTHIDIFQNGGKAGVLVVDAEHADQIVGLLNAATALLAACEQLCDSHGMHGPCEHNSCKTCDRAFDAGIAAIATATTAKAK